MTFAKKCLRALVILQLATLNHADADASVAPHPELGLLEKQVLALGPTPADFEVIDQVLKQDPACAQAHFILGVALQKQGYIDLADEEFCTVAEQDPGYANGLVQRFQKCVESGAFNGAAPLSRFVECAAPRTPELTFFDGIVYREQGRNKEALALFKASVRQNSSIIGLPSAMAGILLERGRCEQALDMVAQDLNRRPDLFEANTVKGEALMKLGRPSEAVEPFAKAFTQRPDFTGSGFAYANALASVQRDAEAVEPALVDMAFEPRQQKLERTKLLLVRLISKLASKQIEAGLQSASERVKGAYQMPRMYFALSDVYDRMGKYRDAVKTRSIGLHLDTTYARGYFRQGRSLEQLGDYYYAVKFYDKAWQFDQSNPQYSESYRRVSERSNNFSNDLAAQLKTFLRSKS